MIKLKLLVIFILISGCSTDSDPDDIFLNVDGQWAQPALTEDTITVLSHSSGNIFAGTTKGLFRQSNNQSWNTLGLQDEEIIDVVIFDNQKILAGTKLPNVESKETSLFLTTNGGNNWTPYQQNFGGENHYNWITALSQHPENPSIIYAKAGALTVAKSIDMGESWWLVNGSWEPQFGFSVFLKIDPNDPDIIWTGGASPTFTPSLIKSSNAGNTWQRLSIYGTESNVYDIAVHPSRSSTILAGIAGAVNPANVIRKSTDGGRSWTTTFDQAGVFTLARSTRDGRIVYAAGTTRDGRLSFFASGDFGDTWQQVTLPDSPADIQVNDMVSVTEDGREVLYLGTNKGIYSYRFEE
jgi:photosystem II stability/assembly factor-like uncharacterized protein